MKMTDLLRIIEKMRLMIVVILLLFASGYVEAMERDALAIRREYNDVSAAIDSLVRMMQGADAEVLMKLPEDTCRAHFARGNDGCDDFFGRMTKRGFGSMIFPWGRPG